MLSSNKTLLNMDIRSNPGLDSILHRKIAIRLLNNIKKA